jgi:hypothetical protein
MTTTDRAIDLEQEVAAIRSELVALQDRFEALMGEVRDLPGGRPVWDRVDAYPGIRLDRDMGAGQGPDGWLAEVAEFLERASDPDRCDGFTGEDAWGPCTRCGRTLADHDD